MERFKAQMGARSPCSLQVVTAEGEGDRCCGTYLILGWPAPLHGVNQFPVF